MMPTFDTAVIGGRLLARAIASELQKAYPNRRVILIGRKEDLLSFAPPAFPVSYLAYPALFELSALYRRSAERREPLKVDEVPSFSMRAMKLEGAGPFTVTLENGEKIKASQLVLANGSAAQALIEPWEEVKKATPRLLVLDSILSTTADAFPLLGESHVKGLWIASGLRQGEDILAPLIAVEMAQGLMGKRHQLPLRFRPSRALLSYKTRTFAIEEALTLPRYAGRREEMEMLYNGRGMENFGIHPEMIPLHANPETFVVINHHRTMVEP